MNTLRIKFVLAAIALSLTAAACHENTASAPVPGTVSGVKLTQAAAQNEAEVSEAVGTVKASESATLSAQIMGTLGAAMAAEGDHVRAGQVLATINAAQMASQLGQARAAVSVADEQVAAAASDAALASSTLHRYEQLRAQKSVSPQEFQEVETRARVANSRLSAVRSQKAEAAAAASSAATMQGYTRIRAPFDGVVTARRADPGTMAAPGLPLLTVDKGGALRLEVTVDESLLRGLTVGATLPVEIPALGGAPLNGKVARIVPAADPASHSFLVKIELPSVPGLYSGMYGRAQVGRQGERQVVTIPRSALVMHGSMQSVYVVGGDHVAAVRYITTGNAVGGRLTVLSGLSAGETIVEAPGELELGGKRIEVRQ